MIRVGSVFIWVMDEHLYGIDIPSWHTGPTQGFMVRGAISYNSQSVWQSTSIHGCCDATFSFYCTPTALGSKFPDFSPVDHVWNIMNQELTLEYVTYIAKLQKVQDAWDNLPQDGIQNLFWPFACENTDLRCSQREYTEYWCEFLGTPYCNKCFIWSEFVIIYSYNDKILYLSHHLSIKWPCHFFPHQCMYLHPSTDCMVHFSFR